MLNENETIPVIYSLRKELLLSLIRDAKDLLPPFSITRLTELKFERVLTYSLWNFLLEKRNSRCESTNSQSMSLKLVNPLWQFVIYIEVRNGKSVIYAYLSKGVGFSLDFFKMSFPMIVGVGFSWFNDLTKRL